MFVYPNLMAVDYIPPKTIGVKTNKSAVTPAMEMEMECGYHADVRVKVKMKEYGQICRFYCVGLKTFGDDCLTFFMSS